MKYIDINKKFSEKVSEYMANGYYINTASMSGTQGEVAKVDLTNGKEIIRVRLESFYDFTLRGFAIIVGKCVDNVKPNSNDNWATMWNDNLEEIEIIRFYELGKLNANIYGTLEESKAARAKRRARARNNMEFNGKKVTNTKAIELAKNIIRREFGYKRICEEDIRVIRDDGRYFVSYRGNSYELH